MNDGEAPAAAGAGGWAETDGSSWAEADGSSSAEARAGDGDGAGDGMGESGASAVPRVLGLLMVVLAFVGLMQSLGGLVAGAGADFEAFLLLGDRVGRWRAFGFWSNLTGLFVGGVHLVAGVWAVRGMRRAPLMASVYAGVAIVRVTFVVVIYYQTTAPVLRPFGKTELFGGHEVGVLIHVVLLLGWAALVVLLMNLGGSRRACSK